MGEVITEKDKEYEAQERAAAPGRRSGHGRPCEQSVRCARIPTRSASS